MTSGARFAEIQSLHHDTFFLATCGGGAEEEGRLKSMRGLFVANV